MIDRIKRLLGMAWSTPAIRTALQSAIGAAIAVLAAAGVNVLDDGIAKAAVAAAVAALVAKIQEAARG